MLWTVLWNIFLSTIATWVIWKSSDRVERVSQALATRYGLPEVVKGSVVTAVSSSFPELSTAVIATVFHGDFELGAAAIIGSAVFNIIVIPAVSVLAGGGRLKASRALIYREAQFYLISVSVLLLTFCFAVIYNPQEGNGLRGLVTWKLAILPIAFYFLYLFIQYHETKDYDSSDNKETASAWRDWATLVLCMLLIAGAVEVLVRCARSLGDAFGTPSFLWGLTIIAAGTSLPDMFISIEASRRGRSVTSLSNVLGSNTFDLLVAVPVGIVLAGSVMVNFTRAVPMVGFLMFATVAMFILMRRDMDLRRRDAVLLLALYVLFVGWITAESFALTSILGL